MDGYGFAEIQTSNFSTMPQPFMARSQDPLPTLHFFSNILEDKLITVEDFVLLY